jgi:hypothetical protein
MVTISKDKTSADTIKTRHNESADYKLVGWTVTQQGHTTAVVRVDDILAGQLNRNYPLQNGYYEYDDMADKGRAQRVRRLELDSRESVHQLLREKRVRGPRDVYVRYVRVSEGWWVGVRFREVSLALATELETFATSRGRWWRQGVGRRRRHPDASTGDGAGNPRGRERWHGDKAMLTPHPNSGELASAVETSVVSAVDIEDAAGGDGDATMVTPEPVSDEVAIAVTISMVSDARFWLIWLLLQSYEKKTGDWFLTFRQNDERPAVKSARKCK